MKGLDTNVILRFLVRDDESDRQLSEEWYGIDGAMIDILNTIFFDLAWLLAENGGTDYTGG